MFDPRIRKERLIRDLAAVQNIKREFLDFDAFNPPAPERYEFRFRLRGISAARHDSPVYTPDGFWHRIEIKLPQFYPEHLTNDDVRFISAPIFHPNVFPDGRVCIGGFNPIESLAAFVLRLARYIQCDSAITGLHSPANTAAQDFFRAHPDLFPCDDTVLPPERRDFVVAEGIPRRFIVSPAYVANTPARRHFVVATERKRFRVAPGRGS